MPERCKTRANSPKKIPAKIATSPCLTSFRAYNHSERQAKAANLFLNSGDSNMAHMVENMMYTGEMPWHDLGKAVEDSDIYDIDKCIVHAGLDWTVELEPLYLKRIESVEVEPGSVTVAEKFQSIDCRYATVRSDNKMLLGTVGPRYTPLQNQSAFDFFKPFLESKVASLHTAGSLDEGRKVWVLAKLALDNAEIVKGDEVSKFVLLSNSHDGTLAVRVGFTPIRVVCMNTLRMAITAKDDATKLIRIRHHKDVNKTLEQVREVMDLANQEFEATAEQYRLLARKNVANTKDLLKYIRIVLNIEEGEKIPKRTENTIEDILNRFEGAGKGANIPGVQGTWWGAYNSITEWLTYDRGHKPDTRMHSLWFGDSNNMNKKALATAVELAEAA